MKEEKRCWVCGRTNEEIKKEKVVEWEENKLLDEMDSVAWTKMPIICNVCLEIYSHIMADQGYYYAEDFNQDIKSYIKKLLETL